MSCQSKVSVTYALKHSLILWWSISTCFAKHEPLASKHEAHAWRGMRSCLAKHELMLQWVHVSSINHSYLWLLPGVWCKFFCEANFLKCWCTFQWANIQVELKIFIMAQRCQKCNKFVFKFWKPGEEIEIFSKTGSGDQTCLIFFIFLLVP